MTDILGDISYGRQDWVHGDDYDYDGAEWIDVTVVSSDYQQQVDISRADHYRHRSIATLGPWIKGMAPDQPL